MDPKCKTRRPITRYCVREVSKDKIGGLKIVKTTK